MFAALREKVCGAGRDGERAAGSLVAAAWSRAAWQLAARGAAAARARYCGAGMERGVASAVARVRSSAVALRVARYLRDDIINGAGYPWDLMFLHSVRSVADWRAFAEQHAAPSRKAPSWLYNLVCAYLCAGFGGTTFRDLAMAQPPGLLRNKELPQTWLLAFALVYYSPLDLVFRLASTPRSLSSLVLNLFEAIDVATTVTGSVDKAQSLFPDSPAAPLIVAALGALGGSFWRYLERKLGRGWSDEETQLARPGEGLRRTLLYAAAYLHLSKTKGGKEARLYVTVFHIVWSLAKELTGRDLDFTRYVDIF